MKSFKEVVNEIFKAISFRVAFTCLKVFGLVLFQTLFSTTVSLEHNITL